MTAVREINSHAPVREGDDYLSDGQNASSRVSGARGETSIRRLEDAEGALFAPDGSPARCRFERANFATGRETRTRLRTGPRAPLPIAMGMSGIVCRQRRTSHKLRSVAAI
jgi:hypothetical protein